MERKSKRQLTPEQLADLSDEPEPVVNVLARAHEDGLITFHTSQELMEAQRLYCIEFLPLERVASKVNRSIAELERWALLGDWHKKRRDRESRLYQSLSGVLTNISATIGVRTDELAANVEGCIDRWVRDRQATGESIEPNDISKLTNSLSKLYELRRTIHGVAGKTEVSKHEISVHGSPVLAESLARAMESLAQAKQSPAKIEVVDADYHDSLTDHQ